MRSFRNLTLSRLAGCAGIWLAATTCAWPQNYDAPNSPGAIPVVVLLKSGIDTTKFEGPIADPRLAGNPTLAYLDRGVAGLVRSLEQSGSFRSDRVFSRAIQGFSAKLTPAQIEALRSHPFVAKVEPDSPVSVVGQVIPWGIGKVGAAVSSVRAGDNSGAVTGVHVYIIDTGIDTSNTDLNVAGHVNFWTDNVNKDCHGHGTHVAGIAGARDNTTGVVGVAPGVPLTGVKVLSCSGGGTVSSLVAGIDWVTAHAVKPAVANLSIGGPASDVLDQAIRNSVASGIFYAVAAGNYGANACGYSPARLGGNAGNGIMSAAAINSTELEPGFSNYGPCVDIWAPGSSIVSTRLGGGTIVMSGTSMSAPHVAGAAALLRSRYPAFTPQAVESRLRLDQTPSKSKSKDGRPIAIVYTGSY